MEQFIGTNYGGWMTETSRIDKNSVIYSFGIGHDISWDLGIIEKFGCAVHAFDMTPDVAEWIKTQTLPPQFHFHPYGLATFDGDASFMLKQKSGWPMKEASMMLYNYGERVSATLPVRRLPTIMKELGHSSINILKMDIEGNEYAVLKDINDVDAQQILVEFHEPRITNLKRYVTFIRLYMKGYKKLFQCGKDYTFVI